MAAALVCAHCRATISESPQATLPAVCPQCGEPCVGVNGRQDSSPLPLTVAPTQSNTSDNATRLGDQHAAATISLPQIPGFDVLEELGRGGMGVVYRARQIGLNRIVAIKMILSGEHAGSQERERFRTEAEAIARLQHPNIVQIYEIGDHSGTPFVVLEFCDGGSLIARLRGTPLAAGEAAEIVEALARGMHHAHQHGIVHRDLKPGNILLAGIRNQESGVRNQESGIRGQGSRIKDGALTPDSSLLTPVPKITDFGLAKKLDSDLGQTKTGVIMGTPSYMSPEQASGRKDIGPAADIYSLGVILYECLTGRPPFRAANEVETISQVLERTPPPLRLLNPNLPHDLETICLKCLQKDPAKRYASASELADDIERWRNGESIHARSFNLLDMVGSSLSRSQYDLQFATWGSMLLWFALIIFLGTIATSVVLWAELPNKVAWVAGLHALKFVVMGVLFLCNRKKGIWPSTTAERQLWVLLGGFVATCTLIGLSDQLLSTPEHPHEPMLMYPRFSIVSGLIFLVLGSSYWGKCYLFGIAFWLLALGMSVWPRFAAAEFGMMWTVALLVIGLHLLRLSAPEENKR